MWSYLFSTVFMCVGAAFLVGVWFIGGKSAPTPAPFIDDSDAERKIALEAMLELRERFAKHGEDWSEDGYTHPAPSEQAIQAAATVMARMRAQTCQKNLA